MTSSILILTVLLTTVASFANQEVLDNFKFAKRQDCSEKRLDKPPGVMSKIPTYDLDLLESCWGFAPVPLIDAWRLKNDPPVDGLTSPLALSIKYASFVSKPSLMDSGSAVDVLRKASAFETCTSAAVDNYMKDKKKNYDVLVELANNYVQSKERSTPIGTMAVQINTCLQRAGLTQSVNIEMLKVALSKNSPVAFFDSIFSDVCKNKTVKLNKIPQPTVVATRNYNNLSEGIEALRKTVDQKLNEKNPSPVGITFCWAALKTKKVFSLGSDGRLDESKCKVGEEPRSRHFASIVGRRMAILKDKNGVPLKNNEGKEITLCQYLVRDSYGTSCNDFPDQPRLDPKNRCEEGSGQIWVDEETLFTNTSEAYYLKDN